MNQMNLHLDTYSFKKLIFFIVVINMADYLSFTNKQKSLHEPIKLWVPFYEITP